MYIGFKHLHSGLAYLVVLLLIITIVNSLLGLTGKRNFKERDLRIPLFTLILSHIQLLVGLGIFFVSPAIKWFSERFETSDIMKNSGDRLLNLEHPLMMIIGIVFITIGFSKHKKVESSSGKFKTLFIFYGIGLILVLGRIPWSQWF